MVDIEFSTGSGAGLIDRLVCSNTRYTRVPLFIHSTFYIYIYIFYQLGHRLTRPILSQLLRRSISLATDCQLCGSSGARSSSRSNGRSYWVRHRGTFLPANKPCIMTLKRGEILKARPPTPWPLPLFTPFWQPRRLLSRNNFGTQPKSYFFSELLAPHRRQRRR